MNNFFLILNIIGIAIYLNLLPIHFNLNAMDSENGKSGILKRGRFSTGILFIYLVFFSKSFGWDGFFGFARNGIIAQIIWLLWNSRSEIRTVNLKFGPLQGLKLLAYNIIGISTLVYQMFD